MKGPFSLRNRTAVVTGAGGGIGRAIACALARRGCHLALADLDETGLAQTADLAAGAVRISRHVLDVGDAAAVAALPGAVHVHHGGVDLLVNNAGVALNGNFEQLSAANFEWLMGINFWGVVRMTRAFLPALRLSSDAHIVNLSSVFGLIAPPGQTAYCASKFAVRGFSDALRNELAGSAVGVTVVHPGGVATSIARHARMPADMSAIDRERQVHRAERLLTMPPARVGEIIVRGLIKRRRRILVGADAKFLCFLERLAPVSYWSLLRRFA
jgi:short-subunit dehydrogenase